MFFDDSVRAFENLRRAAAENATLRFIAWRSPAENSFMTTAERAAAPLLPDLRPRQPDEPGQFAFADPERVRRILEESGWNTIGIEAIDVSCSMPESELTHYITRFGPVGRILQQTDAQLHPRLIANIRAAFDTYVHGSEVRFTSACWMVEARA